jgi:hypothetical protein
VRICSIIITIRLLSPITFSKYIFDMFLSIRLFLQPCTKSRTTKGGGMKFQKFTGDFQKVNFRNL